MRKNSILLAVLPMALLIFSPICASAQGLPTWNGSFTSTVGGSIYSFTMVGSDPSKSSTTTHIKAYIIPLEITFSNDQVVSPCPTTETDFDPTTALIGNGSETVISGFLQSPIFDSTTQYTVGGVDVGTTQYVDAYQRANFWGFGASNPSYHVLLDLQLPVLAKQTIAAPPNKPLEVSEVVNDTKFGGCIGNIYVGWWFSTLSSIVSNLGLQPDTLPIFLTYRMGQYDEASGGYHCCSGTGQTYIEATWNDYTDCNGLGTPCYSDDVSILSHEVAEWMDDPYNNNPAPHACENNLEVGDPLVNTEYYFPYTVNGFTYHLQDLTFLSWFGDQTDDPPGTPSWLDFQGHLTTPCKVPS